MSCFRLRDVVEVTRDPGRVKKERNNLKYIVLVHEESGGYWGECPELPGCFSQGETIDELMERMKEAAELYLDEPDLAKIQPITEIRELVL